MTDNTLNQLENFRNSLYRRLKYRADATMDLIDANAEHRADSVVKLSLSSLFRRTYSSITDVLDNLFREAPHEVPDEGTTREGEAVLIQLLAQHCPVPERRNFWLFATDGTSHPRLFANKLEDRGLVHAPSAIPGHKPITIGHQYSSLVCLTEGDDHWVVPLSVRRVNSDQTGSKVGLEQLAEVLSQAPFAQELCVHVADSAYSNKTSLRGMESFPNGIHIARLRSNRVLFFLPKPEPSRPGRPRIYGEPFRLAEAPGADLEQTFSLSKGRHVRICRWHDLLTRGAGQHLFDLVRIELFSGTHSVYGKPLWLMVAGDRRRELGLFEIYQSYAQRFDIEHYFRFQKRNLQVTSLQTPEVRHEENWQWLCLLSYLMLLLARAFAQHHCYPWEKHLSKRLELSPSQVQRDYPRIIGEIGTPSSVPKRRGNSPGRLSGSRPPHRPSLSVVYKGRTTPMRC